MIQVVKRRDLDNTNVVFIKADEGDFVFTFCGNLDLYFSYFGKDLRKKDEHSFVLDKSNFFLYKCFDDLYDAIESNMPYKTIDRDFNVYFELRSYPFPLFKKGIVEWHSDDALFDEASVLYIEKLDDSYKVTIKEGTISDVNMKTASVRIRNSGSMYEPYNFTFMDLYNKICAHNFECEQITMDEYMDKIKIRKR